MVDISDIKVYDWVTISGRVIDIDIIRDRLRVNVYNDTGEYSCLVDISDIVTHTPWTEEDQRKEDEASAAFHKEWDDMLMSIENKIKNKKRK